MIFELSIRLDKSYCEVFERLIIFTYYPFTNLLPDFPALYLRISTDKSEEGRMWLAPAGSLLLDWGFTQFLQAISVVLGVLFCLQRVVRATCILEYNFSV